MKISEAINELQKLKDEHGDLWITCKMSRNDEIFQADGISKITYLKYAGAPADDPEHLAAALLWPHRFK